jgi:hypothetical protein
VTAGKQIFLNVWGNIFFGYVGVKEGISGGTLQWLTEFLGVTTDPTFLNPGNYAERQMGIGMARYPATGGTMTSIITRELGEIPPGVCDLLPYPFHPSKTNKTWKSCENGNF